MIANKEFDRWFLVAIVFIASLKWESKKWKYLKSTDQFEIYDILKIFNKLKFFRIIISI